MSAFVLSRKGAITTDVGGELIRIGESQLQEAEGLIETDNPGEDVESNVDVLPIVHLLTLPLSGLKVVVIIDEDDSPPEEETNPSGPTVDFDSFRGERPPGTYRTDTGFFGGI